MVQSGGCSACDFRDVFKKNIERRVRSLPEIDGLSKETVLSSWIAKYDAIYRGDEDLRRQPQRMHLSAVSELILSKEQLYEMFQLILGIKKFEHQLLYNACQVRIGSHTRTHKHMRTHFFALYITFNCYQFLDCLKCCLGNHKTINVRIHCIIKMQYAQCGILAGILEQKP